MNHIFSEEGNLKCSKSVRPDFIVVGIPTILQIAAARVAGAFQQPFMGVSAVGCSWPPHGYDRRHLFRNQKCVGIPTALIASISA